MAKLKTHTLFYNLLGVYASSRNCSVRNPKLIVESLENEITNDMRKYADSKNLKQDVLIISGGTVSNYENQIDKNKKISGRRLFDLQFMMLAMFYGIYNECDLTEVKKSMIQAVSTSRELRQSDLTTIRARIKSEGFNFCKRLIKYALDPNNLKLYKALSPFSGVKGRNRKFSILFYIDIRNNQTLLDYRKRILDFTHGFETANRFGDTIEYTICDGKNPSLKNIDLSKLNQVEIVLDSGVSRKIQKDLDVIVHNLDNEDCQINLWVDQNNLYPSSNLFSAVTDAYNSSTTIRFYSHISDVLLSWIKDYTQKENRNDCRFTIAEHTLYMNGISLFPMHQCLFYKDSVLGNNLVWEKVENDIRSNENRHHNIQAMIYTSKLTRQYTHLVEEKLLLELQPDSVEDMDKSSFRKDVDTLCEKKDWESLVNTLLFQLENVINDYEKQIETTQSKIDSEIMLRCEFLNRLPRPWSEKLAEELIKVFASAIGAGAGYELINYYEQIGNDIMLGEVLARFEEYVESKWDRSAFLEWIYRRIEDYCIEKEIISCMDIYHKRVQLMQQLVGEMAKRSRFDHELQYIKDGMKKSPSFRRLIDS